MAAVHKKKGGEIGITMILWQSLRTHTENLHFHNRSMQFRKGAGGILNATRHDTTLRSKRGGDKPRPYTHQKP
jgi:hypothetical protein